MNRTFLVVTFAVFLLAIPAHAGDVIVGALKISASWARATPKGAAVGGGYLTITNTGSSSDRLVSGTTGISDRFELHEMRMDNGVMKMREVGQGVEIKPGEKVEFKPGGYHVMFMGLKQQLAQGQRFKAILQFEKAGKVEVDFAVEGIGAQAPTGVNPGHAMPGMGGMKH